MSHGTLQRDHPRVCGEHLVFAAVALSTVGSSPRMRGTRHHPGRRFVDRGIIPAYAGNTPCSRYCCRSAGDHPRVCGEHKCEDSLLSTRAGSSPRMRGTPGLLPLAGGVLGIIPAYAGNTSMSIWPSASPRDHPRVCGEHAAMGTDSCAIWGSSPRMRGTRHLTWFETP